jgi:glycosyltransferase involved in cell wall biosynthesis
MQRKRLGKTRLRWFRNAVDRFICISSEIDAELDAIGVPAEKRVFIPNGVDVERFRPPSPDEKRKARLDLNLPENAPIAVFTGRLVPEKKVDSAIRIWPEIRAQFSEATLLIVGDGEMRARWESLAGEGVVFAGSVEDVTAYLAAADIFVLPSATEGLSNALLEAMATGLACVVTNVGGASDVITDGVNGRLVDPNEPTALYNTLQALLANKDNIAQLSEGGLQKILSDYRLTVTADRLRALYEQVLNQKSSNS